MTARKAHDDNQRTLTGGSHERITIISMPVPTMEPLLLQKVIDCGGPFDLVLACLDARSLLNLSICHKEFLHQLRYEHVFRSTIRDVPAYFSYSPITQQVRLIKKRVIWVPSPLRMLRLANAPNGCELCGSVRRISGYKLPTTTKCFGLSTCFIESEGGLGGCIVTDKRFIWDASKPTDDRMFAVHHTVYRRYVYSDGKPFRDASGNLCGPYLSYSEWQQPDCEDLYSQRVASDPNAAFTEAILAAFAKHEKEYKRERR